ncbi:Sec-independent protein translocase protein TatB [uncultured Stenotrophomonas sp.]|uniref:Sec-independent protein translocase protein TatB n=1 Tax=uncultured Stenotrophomonas sp. TaxID=165438 RepID=A0A1Y5Q4U2_9GAMM|nr:Sec-independent protein translocase protein TatB [uncultured Stenotrophomonas sp.]
MFDIGFSELLLIAVVALVVLGPERLPKAARFAGLWVRRARNQWDSVKQELERELHAEELKRNLDAVRQSMQQAEQDVRDGTRQVQQQAEVLRRDVEAAEGPGGEAMPAPAGEAAGGVPDEAAAAAPQAEAETPPTAGERTP